ncbi:MAG TPA: glutamine synthetase family protein [Geminicoccaceae bacterium]
MTSPGPDGGPGGASAAAARGVWEEFVARHPRTSSVDLILPDLAGIARGKRLAASAFAAMVESGFTFASSLYGMDATGANVEASGLIWEEGDADRPGVLDLDTLAPVPWREGAAQVLGGLLDHDGRPFFADPRALVRRLLEALRERDLHGVAAFELEFHLLDPELSPPRPLSAGQPGQVYGLDALVPAETFLRTLERYAEVQGLPIKGAVSEYAPGQLEINLGHQGDALRAADHAFLLKRAVKAAARSAGAAATFMALPFEGGSTSGMHLHLSLTDAAGANRFAREPDLLRHAVGGLQATMAEAMLLFAPNPNSFRRLRPRSYAPTSPAWGRNNRTVAIRIPAGPEAARRIEHRTAGADASPYLVLAGVLAGILHGLDHAIEPDQPVTGNGYDRPATLPLSLEHALDAFSASTALPGLLGERFCRLHLACRRAERDRFNDRVTPTEQAWYLHTV